MMKKLRLVLLILAALVMAACVIPALGEEAEALFTEWNPEAPALKALIEYVESVTDEASPDYIPPVDRIATFDMDGTLCGELYPTYLEYYMLAQRIFCDPSYEPDEEMLEFGAVLRDHALDKSFPDGMDVLHAEHAAKAYAGMTLTQFADFVTQQLVRDVDGFEGMTYANTFYLPMIEVVEYLQENGFKVYVCSGSDRFLCRTFIEGILDIPYEQIIGMDVDVEATNENGADGLKYVFTSEDNIVRTDRLLIKNLKMNKVKAIVKEIGRQPVLSFGNSSGDVSMHNYTICNNKYKSAAFMLVADDSERDYGNAEKAQELKAKWEESGYYVISMRDDFRTIYGDGVKKTGTFTWLEDYAAKEAPEAGEAEEEQAAEAPEGAAEETAEAPAEEPADDVKLSDDSSGFVLLSEAVPDAILEIRYYSTYNFVGDRIDGYEEPLAFITKEAGAALKEVSDELAGMGYRLKIFDAYRPQRAVTNFMNWALDTEDVRMKEYFYPELEKDVLFPQGYIAEHSGHSRGSTVDLTLFDMKTEREVDMGGTFDYFGELSHPDYQDITSEQYALRMLLRTVMTKHGFRPLPEEWWHFTLENEPYPDTYFTFPINSDSLE